ncbi:DUF3987 domain-containing protein [Streptomyces sp. NPDC020379]|uniref:DUF3987 domain-containing protein n=1 Tax=Streptomyces sp. NPDC020379 TaxID=3365071 RepID=UPI003787F809
MNTPDFQTMSTGRLRAVVASLAPHVEYSPLGLLVGLLTAFSAMLPETRVQRGSGSMALMLHMLMCGETGEGKGQAWNLTTAIAKDANALFMNGHIINGVVGGAGLIQAIADRGGHALVVDTEYARVMRAGRRQANLSQVLRDLWDGATVATSRAKEPIEVDHPRVAIMGHITPAEFRASMSRTERDSGSYNRLLILPVKQVRWISERDQMPAHLIPDAGEAMARAVRHGQRTTLVTLADDAFETADIVRQDLLAKARESDDLKAFASRCNEQARRVAALFALFDRRTEITRDDLEAAAALVRYSMEFVEETLADMDAPKAVRQPRSLLERARERILIHGGSVKSSQLLPYLKISEAEAKNMPGLLWRREKGPGGGRASFRFWLEGTPEPELWEGWRILPKIVPAEMSTPASAPAPEPTPEPQPAPRPKPKATPKKRTTAPQGASRPEARPTKIPVTAQNAPAAGALIDAFRALL